MVLCVVWMLMVRLWWLMVLQVMLGLLLLRVVYEVLLHYMALLHCVMLAHCAALLHYAVLHCVLLLHLKLLKRLPG